MLLRSTVPCGLLLLTLGCGAEDGISDLNELTSPCTYRAGVVDIHLYDPTDVYPDQDFAYFSEIERSGSCVASFAMPDGQGMRLNCNRGSVVTICSMEGVCLDAETNDLFRCRGTMEFE